MQKNIEAFFDKEQSAQTAISALARADFRTDSIVLHTGGASVNEQTYENTHGDILGSATGFVYSTRSQESIPSMDTYPLPQSTALIADDMIRVSHIFGIEAGSEVPQQRVGVSGDVYVLTLNVASDVADEAAKILTECGATSISVR